jgi:hypothetical protein
LYLGFDQGPIVGSRVAKAGYAPSLRKPYPREPPEGAVSVR